MVSDTERRDCQSVGWETGNRSLAGKRRPWRTTKKLIISAQTGIQIARVPAQTSPVNPRFREKEALHHRRHRLRILLHRRLELHLIQMRIDAVMRKQFAMGADLGDAAVIHYDDAIGSLHRR